MAEVTVSDVVVPSIFGPYMQQITAERSALVQSGVLSLDPVLSQRLAGGGLTFNEPSWRDIPNDADDVSSDTGSDATPGEITADQEIQVRLSRNKSWMAADLAAALAGSDPMGSIASRVGYYWTRRLQAACIATLNGVIKDNVANDSGDYQVDISGSSYSAGVTDFSAEAFIDAAGTLGDAEESVTAVFMHSVVYQRARKNNLIDFIPDSANPQATTIPTFLGRRVIVDDGMPVSAGVYDTWLLGPGVVRWGQGTPRVPVEVERNALANNGGGDEVLVTRVEWIIHPIGHAWTAASTANGGPSNAASTNNLNDAASWNRVWGERKQIPFARLVTRES